jgi:membrane protease YdiL (CAAX protease family)
MLNRTPFPSRTRESRFAGNEQYVSKLAEMSDTTKNERSPQAIASPWHTLGVLVLLAMLALLLIYVRMGSTAARISHIPLYLLVIVCEWAIFAFVLWKTDRGFVAYVMRVFANPRALRWDIPLVLVLSSILIFGSPFIVDLLGESGWVSTQGMLPKGRFEIAVWVLMAVTAGMCEETIFRGYLQQQFAGWTRNVVFGVMMQAVIFGLCHAYQGWKNMTLIFVWGCVFGFFAWLRRGLRTNVIAHTALDIFSAF